MKPAKVKVRFPCCMCLLKQLYILADFLKSRFPFSYGKPFKIIETGQQFGHKCRRGVEACDVVLEIIHFHSWLIPANLQTCSSIVQKLQWEGSLDTYNLCL